MKKIFFIPLLLLIFVGCGPTVKASVNPTSADQKAIATTDVKPDFPYKNDKYGFALKVLPKDYEVKYVDPMAGIVFKKDVIPPKSTNLHDPAFNYTAEIFAFASDNIENYTDLNDFISKKFSGYTFRFVDYGTFSGYYVQETVFLDASSHFYTMNKNNSILYDVYLKVPSKYYKAQQDVFENMVKNMQFF